MNFVMLDMLVAIDRQTLNAWTVGLGAVMNVILNFILIPIMSFTGAAITTVVTNVLICGVCFYFVSKYLQMITVWKMLVGPMVACVAMGVILFYCSNINLLLLVPLAAVVYFVTLLGLKVFGEDEWNIIKRVIRRK